MALNVRMHIHTDTDRDKYHTWGHAHNHDNSRDSVKTIHSQVTNDTRDNRRDEICVYIYYIYMHRCVQNNGTLSLTACTYKPTNQRKPMKNFHFDQYRDFEHILCDIYIHIHEKIIRIYLNKSETFRGKARKNIQSFIF